MIDAATVLCKTWKADITRPITGFENPSIQCFFGGLQAFALSAAENEWQPQRDDQLQPDLGDDMFEILSSVANFKKEVGVTDEEDRPKKAPPSKKDLPPSKKQKIEGSCV